MTSDLCPAMAFFPEDIVEISACHWDDVQQLAYLNSYDPSVVFISKINHHRTTEVDWALANGNSYLL